MRLARPLAGLMALVATAAAAALGGCSSGSSTIVSVPKVAPARTYTLTGFQPAQQVVAGRPTTISFTVKTPDGKPLTSYKTGPGPHTGVHLIIVRDDLAYIIHQHPPVGPDGLLRQTITLPAPGPYRVLADIYPEIPGGQSNFQLWQKVDVAGPYHPRPLPRFEADEVVGGYHFDVRGHPDLHAIQAQFVDVSVTDAHGHAVSFVPWFGALAHAIFFQQGSLNYFHTHICAPDAPNCGSLAGVPASRITGSSSAPGKLSIGVLVPVPGTWRLFLQMKLGGQIVTAPFTLKVAP